MQAQYEEAHPAYAGYTPQMLAQRMPGAFFNSHTLSKVKMLIQDVFSTYKDDLQLVEKCINDNLIPK